MESFLNRYRNITVLVLVVLAQLVLLAVQVKNDQDVRIIRVWTVTAVTPAARMIEALRGGSTGFVRNYILLRDANDENRRIKSELDRLKIENHFLKTELSRADRGQALSIFQARTASKTVAATIIGTGAGTNSKMVFVDRGSTSGVQRGMAVVTPDGIVGKVISAYPTASEVLLITDSDFAAGVISQKSQVRGTVKGQGGPQIKMDYVAIEEKIEAGEMLFTSGEDRIFPRGFPVGVVKSVRNSQPFKEILVEPSGLAKGLEDVLILVEGVHQLIPDAPPVSSPVYVAPPPPAPPEGTAAAPPTPTGVNTEADRIRQRYQAIGEAQKHVYGDNPPGARAVDFNAKLPVPTGASGPTGAAAAPPQAAPPANPPAANPATAPVKPLNPRQTRQTGAM
jgi:rod shape-determining protein MreC